MTARKTAARKSPKSSKSSQFDPMDAQNEGDEAPQLPTIAESIANEMENEMPATEIAAEEVPATETDDDDAMTPAEYAQFLVDQRRAKAFRKANPREVVAKIAKPVLTLAQVIASQVPHGNYEGGLNANEHVITTTLAVRIEERIAAEQSEEDALYEVMNILTWHVKDCLAKRAIDRSNKAAAKLEKSAKPSKNGASAD